MLGLWKWCVRCGRPLIDPKSRETGMGEECASKPGSKPLLDMIARINQPDLIEENHG